MANCNGKLDIYSFVTLMCLTIQSLILLDLFIDRLKMVEKFVKLISSTNLEFGYEIMYLTIHDAVLDIASKENKLAETLFGKVKLAS